MRKNNTLKVLLIAILFTYLLTWILPITYYNGGLYTDVRYPAGLFDIFNYPTLTLYYFGQMFIYVLAVGAFYGVFNKTGVCRKICDKIASLFEGKEIIFYGVVVTLLAVIVAFCGFSYELIFLLPLLTNIILLMKHDKVTVALTVIGSIAVGFMGSLFAKDISYTYMEILGVEYLDLIWYRVIMLVLGIVLLVFNIVYRIKKVDCKKDETEKELLASKVDVKSKKGKVRANWPAILIFDLVLVLMIFTTLDFAGAFNVTIFQTFHTKVMEFAINDYPVFAKILGTTMQNAFIGNWSSVEITTLMVLATIVLAIIYRIKVSDIFDGYKEGAKKFALSALLMLLAYTVLITTSNHPVILTILKPLMEITNGFNSVTLSVSMFVSSIFNVDAYYTSAFLLPYAMSVVTDTTIYPLVAFMAQAMQGLSMIIAPTSIVLLGVIAYLKINYTVWIKNVWKLFLELLLIAFILFTVILLI